MDTAPTAPTAPRTTTAVQQTTTVATRSPAGQWRSVLAGITGVLAVVALTIATIGVWANDEVFDSDEVSELAAAALADQEVQTGLAAWATNGIFEAIEVEAAIEALLPNSDRALAPFVVAGARSIVQQRLALELAEPDLQRMLVAAVGGAHELLIDLLVGGGVTSSLSIRDGRVTLNLVPLVGRGLFTLSEIGLLDVRVPRTLAADDRAGQLAELEAALHRDLPADFGELGVFESAELADAELGVQSAQRTITFVRHLTLASVVMAVLLVVATVILARRRWRAALWMALATVAAEVLARIVADRVVDHGPDLVTTAAAKTATALILGEAVDGLHRVTAMVVVFAGAAIVWMLAATGWRRHDLVVIGAVVLGLVAVGVLGVSAGSLLLGGALGAVAVVAGFRFHAGPA